MKSAIESLLFGAVFCTCLAAEPQLTAEQAKDALLRFIRANRTVFIGDPDPEKLAAISVKALGEGRHALGAFQFDLAKLSYTAAIGIGGPEPHFYSGGFKRDGGVWTVGAPQLQRVRRLPRGLEAR